MIARSAAGVEGHLLIYPDLSTAVPTGETNRIGQKIVSYKDVVVVFRIYEKDEDNHLRIVKGRPVFKDYKIRHHDLKIKLLDGKFYETDEGNFIDY